MKGERVVMRFRGGDEFIYRLKNEKIKRVSYVNNIFESAVLAHNDTVPFNHIDRIYFESLRFYNRLGGALVVGGGALFLIDQFNVVVVNGQEPNLDAWVTKVSLSAFAIGLPMMLLKKKSQRLNYKYHLMTVKKGSIFYEDDPREPISPFLQH